MSVDRAAVFSSGSQDRGLPISQLLWWQPPAIQVLTEGYKKDGSGFGLLLGSEFSLSPQNPPRSPPLHERQGIWGWFGCSGKNVLERRKQLRHWLEICRTVFRLGFGRVNNFRGIVTLKEKTGSSVLPLETTLYSGALACDLLQPF